MSTLLVGDCAHNNLFQLWDADAAKEAEFEYIVARALMCIYPGYHCILFGGGFRLDGEVSRPDLALVAKDYSHWFVIEVELVSHPLYHHVLPQVRAFQYGRPEPDCISILARQLKLPESQIETFLRIVPRSVAVAVNKRHRDWEIALGSLQVQLLVVSAYRSPAGIEAVEVDGRLDVLQEHLGFAVFFATDRSLRLPKTTNLPDGEIMITDVDGTCAMWTVARDGQFTWVTKNKGVPDFPDGVQVQLIRAFGGRISVRRSLRE
jgi:hypothetical protein